MELPTPNPAAGKTILVLEDDDALREMVARVLRKAGYSVIDAVDGSAAADRIAREKPKIDLLLSDILLPGLSGPEFARELVAQNPGLKVIFASGSHSENVLTTVDLVEHLTFVAKPYEPATILAAVRAALG